MDPNIDQAATAANKLLSGLPTALAIVLVLVAALVYLLRLFSVSVGKWIDADAGAKLKQAEVHGATLQALSVRVDAVAPTVIAAVESDGTKTRQAVSDVGDELSEGLDTLRKELPKVCPVPASARPPTCPVTPANGILIAKGSK